MKREVQIILTSLIISFYIGSNQKILAEVFPADSLALVSLYDSTNGADWTNNTSWKSVEPVPNWYGISTADNRVTEIRLDLNNLVGTIPTNFDQLTGLTYLNLERNELSGPFPEEVLNLLELTYLNIRNNGFTEYIPDNIDTLTNLRSLILYNNPLSGQLPETIGNMSNLENITISGTQIDGPIPASIGNLTNLTNLGLRSNELSGTIPAEIGELVNLDNLELYGNNFEGEIPKELGNLVQLRRLFLQANNLTGNIPVELGNLTELDNLQMQGNDLSGQIPAELGGLDSCRILFLYGNQLSGPVPAEIVNLSKLERFYISNNQLTNLPDLSAMTELAELYIQNNKLTFADIEKNIDAAASFTYSPQDSIGVAQDTTIDLGENLTLMLSAGGDSTLYQWLKDGSEIPGSTDSSFTLTSAAFEDAGLYHCRVTNTVATELTLYSRPVTVMVADPANLEDKTIQAPQVFALQQNYPNPFNPSTKINYQLSITNEVELSIYNLLGQKVVTLVSEKQKAGFHQVEWNASGFASGVYYYRLVTDAGFVQTKKLLLLK